MSMPLLAVDRVTKRFGGLAATDSLSLTVLPGEIHAIIGPNGAGKTTLISLLSGELSADSGQIAFDGRDISGEPTYARALLGLARSYQITELFRELTAIENVALAAQAHAGHSFRMWSPAAADTALSVPAMLALERVGLAARAQASVAALAHGECRQLELAMALVTEPKLLLLDEPMAGMSHIESEGIVSLLRALKGRYAILLVEHDMDAVFALADRITVLVYGRSIASGTRDEIRVSPEVREAYLGDMDDSM